MDIHLNISQKEQWKQHCKALLKKSGKSQQEVAEEMAKIIASRENTDVLSTAFISSLSRFINAKGTAFPSWFEQEEERLLPLAQAMKLSSTEVFWNIIAQITNHATHVYKVHPAFPYISFSIPCMVVQQNGNVHKTIPQVLAQQENISIICIVGIDALQRYWAIQEIEQYYQERKLLVPVIKEQHTLTQQNLVSSYKTNIVSATLVLFLDPWGVVQVQQAIDQIISVFDEHLHTEDVQESQRLLLRQVRDKISEELVAIDSSPTAILWMVYDVSQQGILPTVSKQIYRQYQREFIDLIYGNTVLENVALIEIESLLCHLLFLDPLLYNNGWSTKDIELLIERTITFPTVQFSKQKGLSLLEIIESGDKKQRKEALDVLRQSFLIMSPQDILQALEQENLLLQENNQWYLRNIDLCLVIVAQSFVQGRNPMQSNGSKVLLAESLVVQDVWWKFVWLLGVVGVPYARCNQLFESFPRYMYIDIARSRLLFWSVCSANSNIVDDYPEYLEDWAFVVWMESLSIFPYRTKHIFCQSLFFLQQFSQRYLSVLPKIQSWQDIWRIGIPKITIYPDFSNMNYPHIRNIWSVAPYQMVPTTMIEWEEWQRASSTELWKVLHAHASVGCIRSARLVSEGEGKDHALWQQIPIAIRLHWMGTISVQSATVHAFQTMVLEHWNSDSNSLFLSTAENIGFTTVLNWMRTWIGPLFILQYNKDALGSRLARASIEFALFFEAYDVLEQWLQDSIEWMQQDNVLQGKFVTWQSRRIVVQDISEEFCLQIVGAIVLEGAKRLAEKDRHTLLWDFYKMSQQRNTESIFLLMQQQSKIALLECNHVDLIAEWLRHKQYDREIEKRALLDIAFLTSLWKMDVYANRRSEIVRIAALHNPIPTWLIALARKSVLQEKRWPQWLSPFAIEAQHLVSILLETAQYLDKLWWLHCLKISSKTYGPYISDILQEISVWVKQPDRLSIQMQHVYYLGDNSTPRFDALDIFNMLQEMMVEEENILQNQWLQEAMVDIWKELLCHPTFNRQRSNIAMTVYQIIHKMGIRAQLIQQNWWLIDAVLVDQLLLVWFDITTEEELVSYLEHPVVGHRVCVFLLQQENLIAIDWVQQCLLAEQMGILEQILQNSEGVIRSYVWNIIDYVTAKNPQLKKPIGSILLKAPVVWKEPSGRGLLWLRGIFANG